MDMLDLPVPVTGIPIHNVLSFLLTNIVLPDGYVMVFDGSTDSIIVKNEQLGFAVTPIYVKDHSSDDLILYVQEMLEQLKQKTQK